MNVSQARIFRLSRGPAIPLLLCIAMVIVVCCLILDFTVWNQEPADSEPFYSSLPGVELKGLPPHQAGAVLKQLNMQRCRCDCMRTVASCRVNHTSCSLSLTDGREAARVARLH